VPREDRGGITKHGEDGLTQFKAREVADMLEGSGGKYSQRPTQNLGGERGAPLPSEVK